MRRSIADFPRNEAGLVDEFIGTAYDVVKSVHDNLDAIHNVGDQLSKIDGMAEQAVEKAMVPARVEIAQGVADAKHWAEEAESIAGKTNTQYPFTFATTQTIYNVVTISGNPRVNTSGLSIWVEGAIEYDFTILSATEFTFNDQAAFADGTRMRIIVNARFDSIVDNFNQLLASQTDIFSKEMQQWNAEHDAFLTAYGYLYKGDYNLGPITVTDRMDAIKYGDRMYQPLSTTQLPYTTTGDWNVDGEKFNLIGEPELRRDLAADDPLKGLALIRYTANMQGAVSRGAADKLRENVSLRDFSGIDPTGNNDDDAAWQRCFNEVAGHNLLVPKGLYVKGSRTQVHGNTKIIQEPGAIIRRIGTADGWMFVNGEVGNPSWANGYDGDGNIHWEGGVLDLNGFSGRSAAAFIFGHHKRISLRNLRMINGWESHYIEMNSGAHALLDYVFFENQGYENTGSYECVNIDGASQAGFPGYGAWDLTTDFNIMLQHCFFNNVWGGVSSHGIPAGQGQHRRIKIRDSVFQKIASKAIRGYGWNDSLVDGCLFEDIGEEAVSFQSGHRNKMVNCSVYGTSQKTAGQYSAVRIEGDDNYAGNNRIVFAGYSKMSPYSYGIAAGSNRTKVDTRGATRGSSGLVGDNGNLSEIDGRTLIYSGTGGTVPGTVIPLLDALNNYDHLEVNCGAVTGGNNQTAICRPYSRRNWASGTDYVAVPTAQGRFVAAVTAQNSLSVVQNSDSLRQIFGVCRV